MDIEEDIKIVQEFTELDRKLRNYKVESDYDNFCERRCVAIEHVLAEREEDKKRIERLQVLEDDLKDKRIVYVDTPEFEEKFIAKQKVKDILLKYKYVSINDTKGIVQFYQEFKKIVEDK